MLIAYSVTQITQRLYQILKKMYKILQVSLENIWKTTQRLYQILKKMYKILQVSFRKHLFACELCRVAPNQRFCL